LACWANRLKRGNPRAKKWLIKHGKNDWQIVTPEVNEPERLEGFTQLAWRVCYAANFANPKSVDVSSDAEFRKLEKAANNHAHVSVLRATSDGPLLKTLEDWREALPRKTSRFLARCCEPIRVQLSGRARYFLGFRARHSRWHMPALFVLGMQ
jgi:hypothetical protein